MHWYKKLGFKTNPFSTDPLDHDFPLLGRDALVEELVYRINAGSIVLLEGEDVSGKTHLLKEMINKFGGKKQVIYVDGDLVSRRLNIEQLLLGNNNWLGKIVKAKTKNNILLFDNARHLTKRNCERLKYCFDQGFFKSIVFTTLNHKKLAFTPSLKDRIGKRVLKIKKPSLVEAKKIYHYRIQDKELIPVEYLDYIYSKSKQDINVFLQLCESLIKHKVEYRQDELTREDIDDVIAAHEELLKHSEETDADICDKCKEELELVKDEWRCPRCDLYCRKCGSLLDHKEGECPACGIGIEQATAQGVFS